MSKLRVYTEHVAACRSCTQCGADALNLTTGGFAQHPSPWSMLMGSLDADLVIVGQDFASQDAPHDRPDLSLPSNLNLQALLDAAGIDSARVYLTNAVLCLKPGGMSDRVPRGWMEKCSTHLHRTIEIVQPKAVVALGRIAWRGICHAYNVRAISLREAIVAGPFTHASRPALFAVNHCGGLGLAHKPLARQQQDWDRIGRWLRQSTAVARVA